MGLLGGDKPNRVQVVDSTKDLGLRPAERCAHLTFATGPKTGLMIHQQSWLIMGTDDGMIWYV